MKHVNLRRWLSTSRPGLLVAGALFCLFLPAAPASAQQPEPFPPGSCAAGRGGIAGTLRDRAGAPVADAELMAYNEQGDYLGGRSDDSGRYRLERACAGDYVVVGFRDTSPALLGFYDPDGDGEPDGVVLAKDDSQAGGIDLVLSEEEAIVEPAPQPAPCEHPAGEISGRVLDSAGLAVASAEVQVVSDNGGMAQATSLQDGSYKAKGLCAGTYMAAAWDEDPGPSLLGFFDSDEDGRPDEIPLAADDALVGGIDIVLQPMAAPAPEPEPRVCDQPAFNVQGTVRDAGGHSVAAAEITFLAEDGTHAEGLTNADGSYQLALCAGSYLAVAFHQVDANWVQVGFHDPDGDGEPNRVQVDAEHPSVADIDITLTLEDHPAPRGPAGSRARGLDQLRRLASWLTHAGDWARRLTPEQRRPRRPITVEPVRLPLD